MRKIAAFLTALVLFCATAVSLHFAAGKLIDTNNRAFGTWINSKKDLSYAAISNNLEEDTLLMLGSSEFNHGKSSRYHPKAVFADIGMNVMCIGAAKNQCLSHAIAMGALGPKLASKKAVLIISPTWFSKEGIDRGGFSARFSESQFAAMLQNEELSLQLRSKIAQRATELLAVSPAMQENARRDMEVLENGDCGLKEEIDYQIHELAAGERERVSVGLSWKLAGGRSNATYTKSSECGPPDWDSLAKEADAEFFQKSDNQFYMKNSAYNAKIKPELAAKKDAYSKRSWQESPEYDDLRLFLDVCAEEKVEVMLVLLPVNGYWYDYTGFTAEKRAVLENKVAAIAGEYNAEFCDFFGEAYNRGFLEDVVHPAGKGWIRINEKVYEFYNEDEKSA